MLPSLKQFLKTTASAKEVGLLVVDNPTDTGSILTTIHTHHYAILHHLNHLATALQNYPRVVIDATKLPAASYKSLYDVICQYPTGSVELLQPDQTDYLTVSTHQTDQSLLIVVSAITLRQIQKDFDVLSKVGAVWRAESTPEPARHQIGPTQ